MPRNLTNSLQVLYIINLCPSSYQYVLKSKPSVTIQRKLLQFETFTVGANKSTPIL